MQKLREVSRGRYDDRTYSNEETIANLLRQDPCKINSVLTYTYGMDDDRFPLTFLTEGQGEMGIVEVQDSTWTWDVMGRMRYNDSVLYFNTANTTPGINGQFFDVEFKTHLIIEQYGLTAPDGHTKVRVMKDLGAGTHGGYLYRLKLITPNANAYVDPANLAVGKYWSMSVPTVSESYSKGNRSNSMGPGKMTSQMEFHRFSKEIAGNLANTVVSYEFKTKDGGTTNLWINEEMRQFDITRRILEEEKLWTAEYNRDENGHIILKDLDNDNPIPETAGMMQICREANYFSYGEVLTLNMIERSIGDVLDKNTDVGKTEVVLMAGKGFMEDFDKAIRDDARTEGFATPLGDKMIENFEDGLSYGKYFRRYKTIDNHIITVQHLPMLDKGTLAENDKSNGRVHPRTGRPMTSHQAFLLDMSVYSGVRNVRKVHQKGRAYTFGVVKGLSPIPASWGVVPTNSLANDVDASYYQVMTSFGLQVNNSTKMMHLECVL